MADTPSRTVTAIAAGEDQVYVVCNDGTLLVFNSGNGQWIEMPPIPQPAPAQQPAEPTTSGGTEGTSTNTPPAST